jgi:ribonuclease HII
MIFDCTVKHHPFATLDYERILWGAGSKVIAGIDEAGRGPLAGPVVAAAVVFPEGLVIPGVGDSKMIAPLKREKLFEEIQRQALSTGVGIVEPEKIDEINILNATFLAMHSAVENLTVQPDHLLVDGNIFRGSAIPFTTIVDGDALSFTIAAASIIAKVTRDRMMIEYDLRYPGYGFAQHKGYGTKDHREAIIRLGRCPIHRQSFVVKEPG